MTMKYKKTKILGKNRNIEYCSALIEKFFQNPDAVFIRNKNKKISYRDLHSFRGHIISPTLLLQVKLIDPNNPENTDTEDFHFFIRKKNDDFDNYIKKYNFEVISMRNFIPNELTRTKISVTSS